MWRPRSSAQWVLTWSHLAAAGTWCCQRWRRYTHEATGMLNSMHRLKSMSWCAEYELVKGCGVCRSLRCWSKRQPQVPAGRGRSIAPATSRLDTVGAYAAVGCGLDPSLQLHSSVGWSLFVCHVYKVAFLHATWKTKPAGCQVADPSISNLSCSSHGHTLSDHDQNHPVLDRSCSICLLTSQTHCRPCQPDAHSRSPLEPATDPVRHLCGVLLGAAWHQDQHLAAW